MFSLNWFTVVRVPSIALDTTGWNFVCKRTLSILLVLVLKSISRKPGSLIYLHAVISTRLKSLFFLLQHEAASISFFKLLQKLKYIKKQNKKFSQKTFQWFIYQPCVNHRQDAKDMKLTKNSFTIVFRQTMIKLNTQLFGFNILMQIFSKEEQFFLSRVKWWRGTLQL